ncbi:asparagine synthase-related protein [Alkalihalobacillus sp. LMS39]|uniref:asparagine synthase-related protein n=1 Tax=Alkalihalobacillus sp. LMS39 TaxID=2924032 RepID=UPI001FB1E44C|nr:asparagine synthase-related protein [Alkalihalobacillus sp. LMS39]UOE95446.1 asparagine synthase-related protein [Alkalihalobacillus sp. LMS39]
MSAISGIISHQHLRIPESYGSNVMDVMSSFPFDSLDTWEDEGVFLSCLHQWITPESKHEPQPFYDSERQLVICADAIIDNRDELFDRLQISQPMRRTMPDSQLILFAYAKWQEDVPKHLLGDFAFIIWDIKEKKLFGARDFSGARTLYFFNNKNFFAFCTIINPLFTLPFIKKSINEQWLAEFLAIPTMVEAVDMNVTPYQSIYQIPPSHCLSVKDGRVTVTRYFTFPETERLTFKNNEEYEEAFRDVLNQAVKSRLRTLGHVGSHLSGGLDSGSVVYFAANALKQENKKLNTFSSVPMEGFTDWTSDDYIPDERSWIKETVNFVGNIEDEYLSFENKNPLEEVDEFLSILEMPYKFFENAYWLHGITSRAHKKGVKVLLNGARGNHSISWGSWNLTYEYYINLLKKLKWMRLNQQLNEFCHQHRTGKSIVLPYVAKKAFPFPFGGGYKQQTDQNSLAIINEEFSLKTKVYDKLAFYHMDQYGVTVKGLNNYRNWYYQQLFPWNKSGVAGTKLSLRYSLWDRDPTNDIRVIRFCLAVPEEQYVAKGIERSLIRRAMNCRLPKKIINNQHQRGFQGADTIQRMQPHWNEFIHELKQMSNDSVLKDMIDMDKLKNSISVLEKKREPELITKDEFKIATRCFIVARFIQHHF